MLSAVDSRGNGGWFSIIKESWAGAWQSSVAIDAPRNILAFSAVFACVTIIANDIAKLRIKLVEEDENGICKEIKGSSPFLAVLKKPNHYQTRIKFIEQWIISKLLYGNAYVLKVRDRRGVVVALYILDAQRVTPVVADDGSVYYRLSRDDLSEVHEPITVPASEIIHDMMVSLWHPLVGVSPIYACGMSATMGNRIQSNSTRFFANASRPAGILTSPGAITDEVAAQYKKSWNENYGGANVGQIAVLGGGLTYQPAGAMPAVDAQLIEQLKWTVEDVARCFHTPLFKLGGPLPVRASVESDQQTYYSDCLQALIESAEICLDEGLSLPTDYYTEFDLDGLLRMDTAAMITAEVEAVKGGVKAPDEARKRLNLPAVPGGKYPYMQQQNFSIEALSKRDASDDPFNKSTPAAPTGTKAANDEHAIAAKREGAALLESLSSVVKEKVGDIAADLSKRFDRLEAQPAVTEHLVRSIVEEGLAAARQVSAAANNEDAVASAEAFIKGLEEADVCFG